MNVGIVGYGVALPRWRITTDEISKGRHVEADRISRQLGVYEKTVPGKDQDTVTLSVEAAHNALCRAHLDPQKIKALYIGSESHPYAVKPSATIVGQALGINKFSAVADMEFACKAGTAALHVAYSMIKADLIDYAMAIGADTAQAAPGDVLEFTAAAGGAAFIVGNDSTNILATIEDVLSFTTDMPDFWRRSLARYPEHTGRFTAEPAYFYHVETITKNLLEKNNIQPKDVHHVVFHQPNGKFPLQVAARLGFSEEQVLLGLLTCEIGNAYSASSLLGLAAVLDAAEPNQIILVISYGSGSGSDGFLLKTTALLQERQAMVRSVRDYISKKEYISYEQYRRLSEMMY